jgi:MFS family permease
MTKAADGGDERSWRYVSPTLAFIMVSLSLGQLGDGLNIFQGIYLVGIGWNEGSVGTALSLMGFTSLLVQPFAGDWVDKATFDRRVFLMLASIATALSASTILLVRQGNTDHALIYTSKIVEGIASSFIAPCLAALTLASFGPNHFDAVMASNVFWGHLGSVFAAILAGLAAYILYPNIKYCFLVIGASALVAIGFIQYLPQGDPLLGRGLQSREDTSTVLLERTSSLTDEEEDEEIPAVHEGSRLIQSDSSEGDDTPKPASYLEVFLDPKTCILSLTGFFFQ